MKRVTLSALVALLVVGALAGSAFARGGDWEFLPADPFDWQCGTTVVHNSFPVNKEYQRVTELEDGTLVIEVTGASRST